MNFHLLFSYFSSLVPSSSVLLLLVIIFAPIFSSLTFIFFFSFFLPLIYSFFHSLFLSCFLSFFFLSIFHSFLSFISSFPIEIYYSPVIGNIITEKPKDIRGGFLCDEMGMGKTIVTLSLILANPPPVMETMSEEVIFTFLFLLLSNLTSPSFVLFFFFFQLIFLHFSIFLNLSAAISSS